MSTTIISRPTASKRVAPAKISNQVIAQQGRGNAAKAQSQVHVAHGPAAPRFEPLGNQHLIGDGPGEDIAEHFRDAQQLVMPQLGHPAHEHQRNAHEANAGENYPSRAEAINHHSGDQAEGQAGDEKSE